LVLVAVTGAAAGDGLTELFGLKRSENVFFSGEGDGVAVGETLAVVFALRVRFPTGEGDAAVAAAGETLLVGEAVAATSAFLCDRRLAGDGDAVGEGD
jgi:hypothetical protein